MSYIAAGNFMLDRVKFYGGSLREEFHLGGPATFAYSGIKIFTDDIFQCSNVGEDALEYLNPWVKVNDINMDYIKVKCEYSNHSYLEYYSDGTYGSIENVKRHRSDWFQDFGYMKTSPREISDISSYNKIKGLYLAQNTDLVFWRQLNEIKQRDAFKIMWEIEAPSCFYVNLDNVKECLKYVDIFSINIQEAKNLFGTESEDDCIQKLRDFPVAFTLFRVGERGLYVVTQDVVYLLPPFDMGEIKDPTGCGNTSTGAALYGYCVTEDPLLAGIYANVGAALNILQFGVIPNFKNIREEANKIVNAKHREIMSNVEKYLY